MKRLTPLQLNKLGAQALGAKAASHRVSATPHGRAAFRDAQIIRRRRAPLVFAEAHASEHLQASVLDMGAICAYDVKTGQAGLTAMRIKQIAQVVTKRFGGALFYVLEVRPTP